MDREELKKRYASGERNFSGVDLSRLSLTYIDLSDADFSNANLRSANLYNANLKNTNLSNANLKFVNLRCANLVQANLSDANLEKATLHHADLEKANLRYANLKRTNLNNTNLKNANLDGVDLTDAELINANLTRVDLKNTINAVTIAHLYQPSEDNPDLELLSSIKESSHGLHYISEGDYPYEVFLWDVKNQGYFSIDELIQIVGYSDNSLETVEEVPDKEDLKIAFHRENKSQFVEPYSYFIENIGYEIIENINSELQNNLDCQDDDLMEYEECEIYYSNSLFDRFFGFICSGSDTWDEAILKSYKNFAKVVTDNLTNIKIFRLGETRVHVYLVGQTINDNWIGIHTISIET
ncbi:pentapeptide repeat protein [Calothrix parasitica NIES-267]|uniref:Pentapeptide repeat protein n=1 Tax=Calothrix parasitica NIES-267 TaxID=1973488 RepID=A0A1Z4LPT5_9CYAN|nr:pentapeptide repeat protein [Calothrix parasitica NIES-267]